MRFVVDVFDPVEEAKDKDHQPVSLASYEIEAPSNEEATAEGRRRYLEDTGQSARIVRAQARPLE
jgi:hypothetical protein